MNLKRFYTKFSKRIVGFKKHPLTKDEVCGALYRYISFNMVQRINSKPRVYNWIGNLKFYAQIGDAGIVANIYYKLFDYEDSMFLLHHLKKDDLFIDVGANVGHYSLLAGGMCGCNVMAFEPIPTTFSKLNKNIALNKLQDKIKTYNIGIGNENSFLNFTTGKDVMNCVAEQNDLEIVNVEVKKLDDLLKSVNPSFLKIDVEGFEYFVLVGAKNLLAKESLKYIIIEINNSSLKFGHTNQEIFDILLANNFVPIRYNVKNKKTELAKSYNQDKFNTLFIRKN